MSRTYWGLVLAAAAAGARVVARRAFAVLAERQWQSCKTGRGQVGSGARDRNGRQARGIFRSICSALGTVQPYRTVTIRSRVDGQITKVSFKQGQMVKEGDPLIEIDHRPYQAALDQVKAKKQLDLATLANAQKDLERYQKAGTLANSQQQIDTQETLVAQQQAQIAADDAAIESAQTQLDYTTITSPLTGKIGFRMVDPGNIVHAADQTGIVSIVQLQPISVVLTAPEEKIPKINAALVAGVVPVDAFTSDGLKTLAHGHLAFIDNSVAAATGTIGMKATFQNDDQVLYPGLSVAAQTLLETLKQAVVVPEGCRSTWPRRSVRFCRRSRKYGFSAAH